MKYLLTDGYYMHQEGKTILNISNDDGNEFNVALDNRISHDEALETMNMVMPILAKLIA